MSKKVILQKQNHRNVLSKKSRERLLAALLAGSIATLTVAPNTVYASTTETKSVYDTALKAAKTIVYNKVYPSKIVLDGIDLTDKTVANLTLSNTPAISGDRLKFTNNSIIIPQDVVESLNLRTTKYNTSINFEDGTYLSGAFFIQVIEDVDAPPTDTTPDDGIENETPGDNNNPPTEVPDDEPADDEIKDDESADNEQNNAVPEITKTKKVFDYESPEDVVINDVDLKDLTITKVFIGTVEVDKSYLEYDNNSITLSKEAFKRLSLNNGTRSVKFEFSNGYVFSDALEIETINNKVPDTEINKPVENKPVESTKPETTVKPPVPNPAPVVVKPEFPKQTITFNRDKAEDVVIKDVNAKGLKLTSFYIYGQRIDVNKLTVTENSIIIPKEVIWNLYLKNGKYPMSANYENGTYVSGVAFLEMTDGGSIYPEVSEDTVIRYPDMIKQGFEFDWGNQRGINITYVNFNGTKLKSIKVGHKIIEADGFTTTDNSIHVSAEVLESLRLPIGVYNLSFTFSNGVTMTGHSDLTVVHSKDITRNETPIVVNTAQNNMVEIPNLIPEGTMVDSITINNVVLDVIYKDSKMLRANDGISLLADGEESQNSSKNPVVYVENGNVIIPSETLEYIGGNSGNYEVSVRLDNGTTLIQELSVQSESADEDTDNSDSNINATPSTDTSANANANTNANNTTNNSNNINVTKTESLNNVTTKDSTSPKTGDASSLGVLASLLASVGGLATFKRKRK